MKILFSMRHSGALRNFASTVEELARRGHRVHLIFMRRDKLGESRLLHELTRAYPAITYSEPVDKVQRPWVPFARAIRSVGDYARYRAPAYRDAHALRERATRHLSSSMRPLVAPLLLRTRAGLALVTRVLRFVERAIPADPFVLDLVRNQAPDLVLVTPLVDFASAQEEYVKAARTLGVPSGLCVHSWDNLTNKGLIHVHPDRVFVWNGAQVREAQSMHGIEKEHIVPTGAPCYDQWFTRAPSTSREEFCRKVGLSSDKPYLLYLCSSQFIAPREADFVKRWVQALRSAADPRVRESSILIRPHPRNDMSRWKRFDLAEFPHVVLWPGEGTNPVDADSKNDYFDSLYHSAAAVGINTSAQIEAGIVGRQVFSIRAPEYAATQEGTLHFHYLVNEHGGLLHMSDTLEEHTRAIARVFDRSEEDERKLRNFVEGFVRPRGIEVPATPLLADEIEQLGHLRVEALAHPLWVRVLRRTLLPIAVRMKVERPSAARQTSNPTEHADGKPAGVSDRFEKKREWVH
jgi:hypothetical protein